MTNGLTLITKTESWKSEVKDDVVKHLEELLVRAKSGEIQGVAYACVTIDGDVTNGATKTTERFKLIGGLEHIKHRMWNKGHVHYA